MSKKTGKKSARRDAGMTRATAIGIIVGALALAALILALTTGAPKTSDAAPSVAGLGTGRPSVYEFSTDS